MKLPEGPSTVFGEATLSALPPQSLCGYFLPCQVRWAALCSLLSSAGVQLCSRGLGLQESGAGGSSGCLSLYPGSGPPSRSGSETGHIISISTHSSRHPQTSRVPSYPTPSLQAAQTDSGSCNKMQKPFRKALSWCGMRAGRAGAMGT